MAKKKTDPNVSLGRVPGDEFPYPTDNPGPRGFEKVVPLADDRFLLGHSRWEYLRVEPEGQSLVDMMNVHGQQGWEAVSVDAFHGVAYMKRWAS